ncbi:MAG: phosphate acetyltransferase [Candidatus Accumulibacter sp.]|nr:phosphate acetyltransferase [Accumulibacter sp.]
MSQTFTQTFLVVPDRPGVGLTSVALGLVRALQRNGADVRFAKPVAQEAGDTSVSFAREIFHAAVPEAIPLQNAAERIASNQTNELMEEIVTLCMNAGNGAGVLVVEGLHIDPAHPFTSQLNIDLARSLKAAVVAVADARAPGVAANLRVTVRQYANEGCRVAGAIVNLAPENHASDKIRAGLGDVPLWGVVRETPLLQAPRVSDVARHLDAEIVAAGEIATRRVTEAIIAARSAVNVISRLRPGTLVIASGDRDDVVMAVALAASRGIPLAGLLLTHDSGIAPELMDLARPALATGLPILRTKSNSFATARRIGTIPSDVPNDDVERMNTVLDTVAEHLDIGAITASFRIPESIKLSPPAFRYQLIQKARAAGKRIVLPEGDEPRTVRAAAICAEKGIARCVLLGKREAIEAVAAAQGVTLPAKNLEIVDPDGVREKYVAPMVELRKSKGLTPDMAAAQLEDTVVIGTMMLATGDVDGLVSGAVHTTANTVRPALQLIKTAPGSSIVSSVFFMLMPDQVLCYADCAINPNPTAEELAQIAKQTADSVAAFGIAPKVAMISYSTGSSGSGEDVEKVREATEIARKQFPELVLDGPMQYDAASVFEVGRQKAPDSPVAGQATVFVFPDLNTGNTTYKAVQRSAKVLSVGPMLQGLRKPVNDLSRGALVDDIVFTIALTAIQAASTPQG